MDLAGNVEAVKTKSIQLDKNPPVTTIVCTPPPNALGWSNTNVTCTLTATDTGSGVAKIEYGLNSTSKWTVYTAPVTVSTEGTTKLYYRATDRVNKVETYNLDKTAPATTAALSGTAGTNGWYKSSVTVTLTATDAKSGVDYINYNLDGGPSGPWTRYTTAITISAEGSHAVYYQALDKASNWEAVKQTAVKIDKTVPAVVSTDPAGGATGVPTNKVITMAYSEPIVAGSNYSKITLKKGSTSVTITKSISGNVLTISHAAALATNSLYTVTVPAGGVNDLAGNACALKSFTFTTTP